MSTISMRGIAMLAHVQRPVVSMWRSRTRLSDDPFPTPVVDDPLGPKFDPTEVAAWLVRTGRGNNPEAVLDAAAHASPAVNAASPATLTSLLALRVLHGAPIAGLSFAELQQLSKHSDPTDEMLRTEISAAKADLSALARHVDAAVDADYTAVAVITRFLQNPSESNRAYNLTAPVLELLDGLMQGLTSAIREQAGTTPTLVLQTAAVNPLLFQQISSGDREFEIDVRSPADAEDLRMLRRVMTVAGQPNTVRLLNTSESGHEHALRVLQLPATGTADAVNALTEIDDVALSMTDDDSAVVLGPASLLVDSLAGESDQVRSHTLRLGRVRAIVRLPRGCATGAPRAHLAIWVLGPRQLDVPNAERSVVTIDLDGLRLTPDVRHDTLFDVLSSVGEARIRHLRAFRFATLVLLRSLIADGGDLVQPRRRREPSVSAAEVISRFFEARDRVGVFSSDLLEVVPSDAVQTPLPTALLGDLVSEGAIRRLSGMRLPAEALIDKPDGGFRIITANEVCGQAQEPRFIDRLLFAQLGRRARLTEPGDVIVVGGEHPAAMLDQLGAHVVEAPATVLRVDRETETPIEPATLRHDIERFAEGAWGTWPIRRLATKHHGALRKVTSDIADRIDALHNQIEQLEEYEQVLVDGFAAGVLSPAEEMNAAPDPEGGR